MATSQTGWQFWVDRGGTFTDIVGRSPSGQLHSRKLLSENPDHYADAIGAGIADLIAPGERVAEVRLGTTVATNALLTLGGVKTVLVVTEGHGDLLAIGDQRRAQLFNIEISARRQLAWKTLEARERIAHDGNVVAPLLTDSLLENLSAARAAGAKSVAISLLHAYSNPVHEIAIARLAQECGFENIVMSHLTAALPRYLGRTTTTLIDAYLHPVLQDYLERLRRSLKPLGSPTVSVMQSHGGLTHAAKVRARSCLLSGPAGGVIGMIEEGAKDSLSKLIGFDMGGTSTDVTISAGQATIRASTTINDIEVLEPHVDVRTIAAGGGSILSVRDSRLIVGPASAGANPGPACYRAGGPATVTDANVLLGRIAADRFPKQFGPKHDQAISRSAAAAALQALAAALPGDGASTPSAEQLAEDYIDVAVEQMAAAIRAITFRAGIDPADYCLAVFGGAGGQHACQVAENLGIRQIWLHPLTGILSALGMGLARVQSMATRSVELAVSDIDRVAKIQKDIESELLVQLEAELPNAHFVCNTTAGCRVGVSDAIIELAAAPLGSLADRFSDVYEAQFGMPPPRGDLVLAYLRVDASDSTPRDIGAASPVNRTTDGPGQHDLYLNGRWVKVPLVARESLQPGSTLEGPALISDAYGALVLRPHWHLRVTDSGSLLAQFAEGVVTQVANTERSPRLLEIFNGRFRAIAEHMGEVLERTAQSVNIRERLDYSCALFDAAGQLIANAPHMPVHLGSMGESVRAVIDLPPCDGWLLNSPYAGGTHLPDMTVVLPWLDEKSQRRFFLAARAHHADVGGITPASIPARSTHIEEEGALFGPTELIVDGVVQTDSVEAVLGSGRWPARDIAQNMGDLRAQIAACRAGQAAVEETLERYSLESLVRYGDYVIDNAAEAVAAVVRNLRGGRARAKLDSGAVIQVEISVIDDRLSVDFAGSAAQSSDNFNAPTAVTRAALLYVLRCLVGHDIPLNDGCLRSVDLKIPEGSILDPTYPAAVVAGNVETSQVVTDVLFSAMGVLANSQGTMNNLTFGNERFQYYETIAGGSGAGRTFPGADAVQTHMTNSRMTDSEILEARFPVRVETYRIRPGSGGAGRNAGGAGCVRRIRFLEAVDLAIVAGRRIEQPQGLAGGDAAAVGLNRVVRANGQEEILPSVAEVRMQPGDCIEIHTPGGGGFGANS